MRQFEHLSVSAEMFAKSNAFEEGNDVITRGYRIIPVYFSGFAKSNALTTKFTALSNSYKGKSVFLLSLQRDHFIGSC